ncbi:F0F1 ATP synthase subunit delta [Candidatus Azambacteria bacterium]|nr:F0F1 ATP synthase subunit delta [Candidatus Azambacteria bacterium]MBI3685124.1 F0F1 ATP synthase subunit delta [Candidatus Azambacteria bacterium]
MKYTTAHYANMLIAATKDNGAHDAAQAVASLARFLREKNRLGQLERVLSQYRALLLKRNMSGEIHIQSAVPLSSSLKKMIREKLDAPEETVVKETVNASLIGGIVAKYNDVLIDTSLRRKLKRLEGALLR